MLVLAAFILDTIVGDPRWLLHPVVIMGWTITWLERFLRRWIVSLIGLKSSGVLLTALIVAGSYGLTAQLLAFASHLNAWLGWFLAVWLLASTIAAKSLYLAASEIYSLLKVGDLVEARIKVGWIVGRDTNNLEPAEIMRATVETVAENIVDGIISPLFYGLIGGVPLAMAYRAVNTLDSMVGYKNEKYLHFGWASARLDDLANYFPARITALLILLAAAVLGYDWQAGWQTIRQDASKHPSPNSGYPEAATAGVLGIRLGGLNYYAGQPAWRAYMGDQLRQLEVEDIRRTWHLMYGAAIVGVLVGYPFLIGYHLF